MMHGQLALAFQVCTWQVASASGSYIAKVVLNLTGLFLEGILLVSPLQDYLSSEQKYYKY